MTKLLLPLILSLLASSGPRLHAATEQVQLRAGIVAVVNDRLILGSDLRERMYSMTETLRRQYRNNSEIFEQKLQAQQRNVLEELINDELIMAEAIAAGRQVPEKHLDQYMAGLIQTNYYGDSNLFLQTLVAQGTTIEEFRDRHRQNDLVSAARRGRTDNIEPPMPEQIEEYYRAHEQDFRVEESVKLGMIVLNQNPTNGLAAVESQRKLAAEIRALLAEGRDFATVAQTYSQGGRAQQGGDWGWLARGVLRKELDLVAFSLKPGELSDVVETKEAWYIMRVADHRPGALKPLAEVRAEIWKTLQTQDRAAVLKRWLDGLRADAFVRYYGGGSVEGASSPNRVFKIEIKHIGASTLSDTLIRSHLRVKEGELVTQANADHDIRSLYGTGDFYDIRVMEETLDGGSTLIGGSKLIYVVQEKPMLGEIQFAGNTHISRQELLPKLTSKTGGRLDERKLFNDTRAIQSLYQKAGYPQTTVQYVPNIDEPTGRRGSITFKVTEGAQ